MKYFVITEYDPEGGWENILYVDTQGAFKRLTQDVFSRAVRAISYLNYVTIGFILSELPGASVRIRGEEIELAFPNPAE